MGFVVLHINKASGNDAGMTAHIERTIDPKNADQSRTCLNEDLIAYPDGVKDRTQAIQHRLDNAGLTRKIGTNQVRALRIMLSGTPEDMQRIQAAGKLGEWCDDNINWLQNTFSKDNLVSAVLHMDEKTPHIHAAVVPVVTGERRKAAEKKKPEQDKPDKKKYRKKNPNAARLCADDIMTRDNLKLFQDTYAEAMAKYGLQRGIDGSEARHITNLEFYRDITANKQALQDEIENLQEAKEVRQQEVTELEQQEEHARTRTEQASIEKQQAETELVGKQSELQKIKGELKTEKFKSSATDAGSALMDGISSALGTSKVKRQQAEIDDLKAENGELAMRLDNKEMQIRSLHRDHQSDTEQLKQAHEASMASKQKELDRIAFWFPDIPQMTKTADYCRDIGFSHQQTKELLMLQPVQYTGKLRSPKTGRSYEADNVTARLESPSNTHGFTLTINGTPILQWFKQKFDEIRKITGLKIPEKQQNRGVRLK